MAMRRRASVQGAMLMAVLGSLLGCGGQPPAAPTPSASARSSAHASSTPVTPFRNLVSVSLGAGPVAGITMWSHYIAWARESGTALVPQAIEVFDRDTHVARTVVSTKAPQQVGAIRGSGDLLVYTQADPTDESHTTWSVHLLSLKQGSDRVIAQSSGSVPLAGIPQASIEQNCLAWNEPVPGSGFTSKLVIYDAVTGSRRSAAGVANPESVSIDGGEVFFDADTAQGRDAFSTPCSSPATALRITTSGKVAYPRAGNGVLVWQEPLQGDPMSIWAMPDGVTGANPVALTETANQGNAYPGAGFGLWLDGDGMLSVRDLTLKGGPIRLPDQDKLSIAARWSVLGNTVAWVNGDGSPGQQQSLLTVDIAAP